MTRLFYGLLASIMILCCSHSFAQINFNFSIYNSNSSFLTSSTNTYTAGSNAIQTVLTFDLTSYGICEGSTIGIKNNSNGYVQNPNDPGMTVNNSTEWDLAPGFYTGTSFALGGYLLGAANPFGAGDLWNPNPFPVVLSNTGAFAVASTATTITYSYITAPELDAHFWGVNGANCVRAVVLEITVNKAPDCIDDLTVCSYDDINDLIPNGVVASGWVPFDPTTTVFDEDTEFTVNLSNSNGVACATTCTFDINFFTPQTPIITSDTFCASDLPYFGTDVFASYATSIVVNNVEVFNNFFGILDASFFDNDLFVINSSGSYSIVQSFYTGNDQDVCSVTFNVLVNPNPKIDLPAKIGVCDENFQFVCGPAAPLGANYAYEWWGPDPQLQQSVLLSTSICMIPLALGSHKLVVTNTLTGCSSEHIINFFATNPPLVTMDDVQYCEGLPMNVGFPGSHADAAYYSWTFNGNPTGGNSFQTGYVGDGEYCVTIMWLSGCESEACFTVEQCCEPDPTFGFTFLVDEITVWPVNAANYTSDNFLLYEDCGSGFQFVSIVSRTSNFNTPVVFSGLDPDCIYKVMQRVYSECLRQVFVSEHIHQPFGLRVSPNPAQRGGEFRVELDFDYEGVANLEIVNAMTGVSVLTGSISNNAPFVGSLSPRGGAPVNYIVRVTTNTQVITEPLMLR